MSQELIASTAVWLGRCQPVHFGHLESMKKGLIAFEKLVIVLGSHLSARTCTNPWTAPEREELIRSCFSPSENDRISFEYAEDFPNDDTAWAKNILSKLNSGRNGNVTHLIEYHKDDATTSALDLLRATLGVEAFVISETDASLSSTTARQEMFSEGRLPVWVPRPVRDILESRYIGSDEFQRVQREHFYVLNYKALWKDAPYPVTFVASDAICISGDEILMIVRNKALGNGLLALPGGFLEVELDQSALHGCLRELREETALYGMEMCLVNKEAVTFDYLGRCLRGRVISHAFRFDVPKGVLEHAVAGDDAGEIRIVKFSELDGLRDQMFSDHYHIIKRMAALEPRLEGAST